MNTAKLRTKRVILPTIAAVAALGIGGVVWASTANADLQGSERDRVVDCRNRGRRRWQGRRRRVQRRPR